jgi:hypothetical protein
MAMLSRIVGVSFLLLLAACDSAATMRGAIDTWKGRPLQEAVDQWGEPTQQTRESGPRTLTWTRTIGGVLPGYSTGTITPVGGGVSRVQMTTAPPVAIFGWCRVHLSVDEQDIIQAGRHSGNDCCLNTFAGYCGNLPRRAR